MATMTKNTPKAKKSTPKAKAMRVSGDYTMTEPEPALLAPRPVDQAEVRIGAVVRLADNREGTVKAIGAHRIRVQPSEGASYVVLRSEVARVITVAPERKASSSKGSKGGPKTLRIPADASVPMIAEALLGWGIPTERLEAACQQVLEKLAIQQS